MGRRSSGEYREAVLQVLSWRQRRILAPAAAQKAPGEESLCHNLSSSILFPHPGPCEIPSICRVSRTGPSSSLETLPCPRVIFGIVVPRAHDVAIQEVLVQPHVLASQLPPPEVPQHAQGVVYVRDPPVVARSRVVGPFAGQEPLPLLREVLDLLHDLSARHRFAS